ncbi:hypothetical protein [Apis mellifera associated microvirus 39]|nr:hypothetical protein [Apis mellifera associated microvirus 39]
MRNGGFTRSFRSTAFAKRPARMCPRAGQPSQGHHRRTAMRYRRRRRSLRRRSRVRRLRRGRGRPMRIGFRM